MKKGLDKLNRLVKESLDKDDDASSAKLFKHDVSMPVDHEKVRSELEKAIKKALTDDIEIEWTDFGDEINDVVRKVLEVNGIDIQAQADVHDLPDIIDIHLVVKVNDIQGLIDQYQMNGNPDGESKNKKVTVKKAEKSEDEPEPEAEPVKEQNLPVYEPSREYTDDVIETHGYYLQENLHIYGRVQGFNSLLKEFCAANKLKFGKIDRKYLLNKLNIS